MRPWNWRRLFAAAVGLFALASAAPAQSSLAPARPAKSYVMAYPGQAPATAGPVVPAAAVVPAGNAAYGISDAAAPAEGCSSCGGRSKHKLLRKIHARLYSPGCANPVTCGNWRTDKTFIFGGCCQFFGHGRNCGSCGGCGKGGLFGHCQGVMFGPGMEYGMNPCCYDSYLNH